MYQPKTPQNNTKLYDLDTVIDFGKYKPGNYMDEKLTVKNVIDIDPDYFKWCVNNIDWFDITPEVDDYLFFALDNDYGYIV